MALNDIMNINFSDISDEELAQQLQEREYEQMLNVVNNTYTSNVEHIINDPIDFVNSNTVESPNVTSYTVTRTIPSGIRRTTRRTILELPQFFENSYEFLSNLSERIGHVSKGASNEDINKLPVKKYVKNGDDTDNCVVCQSNFVDNESNIKILPCDHFFCQECIDKWLKINKECPICRKSINT